jgi:Holliday junction resolvase
MNSKEKGKRGEREWATYLTDLGFAARRGQQFRGGPDSPDICGGIDGTHAEVKRVERLLLHDAMQQAVGEAGVGEVPYVASRRNRGEWLVTIRASDLLDFARCLLKTPHEV